MDLKHLKGLERTVELKVTEAVTASAVGSGGVEVLSTPSMILLFEQAARDAVQPGLPEGHTTVGTRVDVRHLSATPMGETVTVTARAVDVEGRRVVFKVSAFDRKGEIGAGTHERFVVDLQRFMGGLRRKFKD